MTTAFSVNEWRRLELAVCDGIRAALASKAVSETVTVVEFVANELVEGLTVVGVPDPISKLSISMRAHTDGEFWRDGELWVTVMRLDGAPGRRCMFDGAVTELALDHNVLPIDGAGLSEGLRGVITLLRRAGFSTQGQDPMTGVVEIAVDAVTIIPEANRLRALLESCGVVLAPCEASEGVAIMGSYDPVTGDTGITLVGLTDVELEKAVRAAAAVEVQV